jgi:CheY-like chemotaxis protein
MDIQMPGMDGVEATRRIRDLGGDAAATPIVAMTANALAHQQASYIAAGMNGAVAKPLSPTPWSRPSPPCWASRRTRLSEPRSLAS